MPSFIQRGSWKKKILRNRFACLSAVSCRLPEFPRRKRECVFAAIKHERVLRHSQESLDELALAPGALRTLMAETRDANTENLFQLLHTLSHSPDFSTFVA